MAELNKPVESGSDSSAENLTPEQIKVKQQIDERMAMVNGLIGKPEDRALPILNKIRDILQGESSWDVVCACTQFLGDVAPLYNLENEVKQLGLKVHIVHYFQLELPK